MIGTSEAVLGASSLGAMNRILIAIVTAIVIAVAEPVRLHADVCFFALEMIQRTCSVARTALVCLIGSEVVLAIVDAVAHLRLRYASIIGAGEFARCARWIDATLLVATIPTVVFVVALPRFEDASAVVAAEFVRAARMIS